MKLKFKRINVQVTVYHRCELNNYGSRINPGWVEDCDTEFYEVYDVFVLGDNDDDYGDVFELIPKMEHIDKYFNTYNFDVDTEVEDNYATLEIEVDTAIEINGEWYIY